MTSLTSAWNWWLDGLTDAVSAREARRHGLRRVRLEPSAAGPATGYDVQRPGAKYTSPGRVLATRADGSLDPGAPALLAQLSGQAVDLVLAADEVLVRTLDPLPAESRGYLDGIVQHNLERITPWRVDDVLRSYHEAPLGATDGRLLVTIVATARPLLQSRLDALVAAGARDVRLIARGAGPGGDDAVIDVGDATTAARRRTASRKRVLHGLAGLVAAGALLAGGLQWALSNADARLAQVDAAVKDQRAALLGGQGTARRTQEAEGVWRKKLESMAAVIAIEALAAALPDDTFLTELRVGDGRVRLTGVSRNVTALVPALERAPQFTEARFFAPTIRLPDGQGNQFHLEAKLRTAPGARP